MRVRQDLDAVGSMAAYLKQKGYAHLGWLLDLQVITAGRCWSSPFATISAARSKASRPVPGVDVRSDGTTRPEPGQGFAELNLVLKRQWTFSRRVAEPLGRNAGGRQGSARGAEAAASGQARRGRGQSARLQPKGAESAKAGHEAVLDLKEEFQRNSPSWGSNSAYQCEQ